MKLSTIFFLYSLVFLGKHGLSQTVGEQDDSLSLTKLVTLPKAGGDTSTESASRSRALQGCSGLFATANLCTDSKPGCRACINGFVNVNTITGCSSALTNACRAAQCSQCDGCELAIEAAYRCDILDTFPTCSRLDCNLGIVPFLGEIPVIGVIFNLLFGWLWNLFN